MLQLAQTAQFGMTPATAWIAILLIILVALGTPLLLYFFIKRKTPKS